MGLAQGEDVFVHGFPFLKGTMIINSYTRQFLEDAKQDAEVKKLRGKQVMKKFILCDYLRKTFGSDHTKKKQIGKSNGFKQVLLHDNIPGPIPETNFFEEVDSIDAVEGRIIYALCVAGFNLQDIFNILKIRYNYHCSSPLKELIKIVKGEDILRSKIQFVNKKEIVERIIYKEKIVEKIVYKTIDIEHGCSVKDYIKQTILIMEKMKAKDREIAKRLGISTRSIRSYRREILDQQKISSNPLSPQTSILV